MMDTQSLLSDFLNDLEATTDDELIAVFEKAKNDSQNSFSLETFKPPHEERSGKTTGGNQVERKLRNWFV